MAFSRVSARWNRRLDTKLVVGAVGVNGGSWLEVLSCGVNEGWVSELLVKLLKIHQIEPTSDLLIGGSQQPSGFLKVPLLLQLLVSDDSKSRIPLQGMPQAGESEADICCLNSQGSSVKWLPEVLFQSGLAVPA